MAGSIIKIKRSKANGAPGSLEYGELAYSGKADTNKLFIGMYGDGAQSSTVLVTPIGGKFYTDLLDVTPGTVTASKAIVVDGDSKISELNINKLYLNNNVVTTNTSTGNLQVNAGGSGLIQFYDSTASYTFPRVRGDAGTVLTLAAGGVAEWKQAAVDLNIHSNVRQGTLNLLNDSLNILGSEASGISTDFNDTTNTLTIYGMHATANQLGVASFEANDFDIDSTSHVSVKKERIQDMVGELFTASYAANLANNISVTYSDDDNQIKFIVNTASTTTAGIAKFDSNYFQFGTSTNLNKVSLKDNVLQTITVPDGTVVISSNTLALANGTGISISGTGASNLTIAANKATAADFGVAKFSEAYFDMTTPGVVKIDSSTTGASKAAASRGIASFSSANFNIDTGFVTTKAITLGTTALTVGDTTLSLAGLTTLGAAQFTFITNEIKGTVTDDDIKITPLGNGNVVISDEWYLPNYDGLANQVLTAHADGTTTWESPKSDIIMYGDATNQTLTIGVGNFKILGGDGLDTTATKVGDNVIITVAGTRATTSDYGVAKYFADEFDMSTAGTVKLKALGIANGKLANSTIGVGSTSIALGGSATIIEGLTSIEVSTLKIGGSGGNAPKTIASTEENGDIYISPDKTSSQTPGRVWISNAYKLPAADGTDGQVLITHGNGNVVWDSPVVTLNLDSMDGSGSLDLKTGEALIIEGVNGIETSFNNASNTFTIAAVTADDNGTVGVASYTGSQFNVSAQGLVSLADNGITNAKLVNKSITIGTTAVDLGATITTLVGMTGVTTGNIAIGTAGNTNSIRAVNSTADGDITISPKGAGVITLYGASAYSYTLPATRGTNKHVLTTNGAGVTEWKPAATYMTIGDEHSHSDTISLTPDDNQSLLFKDGVGTIVTVGNNEITISGVIANGGLTADDTIVGVASYTTTQFSVSAGGKVTLVDEGIQDIVGAMLTGTGYSETNIEVRYVDSSGKLTFNVKDASDTVKGAASFNVGDFVTDAGDVSLAGTVLKGISGNSGTATPASNVAKIEGTGAISTTGATDTLTISVATATASTLGVASFPTTNFTLAAGEVGLKKATYATAGIAKFASSQFSVDGTASNGTPNAVSGAGAITVRPILLGDQSLVPGNAVAIDTIKDLVEVDIGDLKIATNTIEAIGGSNTNLNLKAKGTGTVSTSGFALTGLPVDQSSDPTSAVSKAYADGLRSGLTIKDPVRVATAPDGSTPNANGVSSTGVITLTYTGSAAPVIDGVTLMSGDRVLVKNQEQVADEDATTSVENGIWVWTLTVGTSAWARAADANSSAEMVSGMFTFVQEGDKYQDCGWVLGTDAGPGATIWTSGSHSTYTPWKFVQFSAAGVITVAPNGGIIKAGQQLRINSGVGLDITANVLSLASTVAGAGLVFSSGVVSVNTDDTTLAIDGDTIKIKSTYGGQASITTVGTIASGIWNGTAIGAAYGGTGLTSVNKGDLILGNSSNGFSVRAMNGASNLGKVLQVVNTGTTGSPVYEVDYADIDGGEY